MINIVELKKEIYDDVIKNITDKYFLMKRNVKEAGDISTAEDIGEYMAFTRQFVIDYVNVPIENILGGNRDGDSIFARQIYFYLVRTHFNQFASFQAIADTVGKNHATVLHAIKTLKGRMDTEKRLREQVTGIYTAYCEALTEFKKQKEAKKVYHG